MSAAETARQILLLEASAVRRLRLATASAIDSLPPGSDDTVAGAALVTQVTAASVAIRSSTRTASAAQFAKTTGVGVDVDQGATNDANDAIRSAMSYARAWRNSLIKANDPITGGSSGGGGATDDWFDARTDSLPAITRIATWDVVHAWNSEHQRQADMQPQFKFAEKWCAILDPYLCPNCKTMNGRLADVNGTFAMGWPPLHGGCRCFIVTTLV